MSDETSTGLREEVRARYAEAARAVLEPKTGVAASCCGSPATDSCCGPGSAAEAVGGFSEGLYREGETDGLPQEAVMASLGCGNPLAVADLHEGERVLDLGSGGGIDVLLSARRVGPSGFAYGVDMTEEMLTLARANAAEAGTANVEFLKGEIEALPRLAELARRRSCRGRRPGPGRGRTSAPLRPRRVPRGPGRTR